MGVQLIYRGKEIALDQREALVLGRHRDCDVVVNDKAASRNHTRLEHREGGWWVVDLGSANGTKLNQQKVVAATRLRDGDLISIGESLLKFTDSSARNLNQTLVMGAAATADYTPASATAALDATPAANPITVETPATIPTRTPSSPAIPALAGAQAKVFAPADLIGVQLAGYRLTGIIIERPAGILFTAKQLKLDRQVAVNILRHPVVQKRPDLATRIVDAARIAGRLNHQGIVQIHECGFDDGLLWYSMEYVEGDILGRRLKQDGRIELPLVLLIAERLAAALKEVHRLGLAHGDIRPDNVLISATGLVKLVDAGVAPLLQEARQVVEGGSVRGNPLYLSPEAATGAPPSVKSDIYALGCLLFHCATGKPPYPGHHADDIIKAHANAPIPHLSETAPDLPTGLDDLLQGMLAKNPEWRYADIGECQEAIRVLRQNLSTPSAPPAPVAKPKPPAPRRPTTPPPPRRGPRISGGMVGLILLAGVIGAGAIAWPSLSRLLLRDQRRAPVVTTDGPNSPGSAPVEVVPPRTHQTAPTPTNTTELTRRWQALDTELAELRGSGQWARAEFRLAEFSAQAQGPGTEALAAAAISQGRQVANDAQAWYQQRIAVVAAEADAARRLSLLAELREQAASGQRADAESRHRETMKELVRKLAALRRDAVALLEDGQAAKVEALVSARAGMLRGTAYHDLEQQLAVQAREAAHLAWAGDWPSTRQGLSRARGEAALGAAAVFLLLGERAQALSLLFNAEALPPGPLEPRRDALLATQALVLDFDSPADASHFALVLGEVQCTGGRLTGPRGAAAQIDCIVAVGGREWEMSVALSLHPAADNASASLSLINPARDDESGLDIRWEDGRLTLATAGVKKEIDAATGAMRLRLRCNQGKLRCVVGDNVLCDEVPVAIPSDCRLRLAVLDLDWAIDELQILGGG